MQEHIYQKMYEVEDRHWWYSAKRRIIRHLLERYLPPAGGSAPRRLADLGCGCGRLLEELPPGFDGVGVDASETAVEFCRKRGVSASVGSLPAQVPFPDGTFDAVILADILEHVEDDEACARAAARLLRAGGVMIVTAPAYPALWSSWDEIHGHRRRYTLGTLRQVLATTELDIELLSYYNMFLLPPAALARVLKKLTLQQDAAELSPPPGWINSLLRGIFAGERHLLGRLPLPAGLSLIAVLRRP